VGQTSGGFVPLRHGCVIGINALILIKVVATKRGKLNDKMQMGELTRACLSLCTDSRDLYSGIVLGVCGLLAER